MTIYSSGLKRVNHEDNSLVDKISNFVKSIRIDANKTQRQQHQSHLSNYSPLNSGSHRSPVRDVRRVEAKDDRKSGSNNERPSTLYQPDILTDQLLVQAEKFKVRVEAPKGNNFSDMLLPYSYKQLRSRFVKP